MAKILSVHETARQLAELTGRPTLYIVLPRKLYIDKDWSDFQKAAPILKDAPVSLLFEGYAIVQFDTELEMNEAFDKIHGDDWAGRAPLMNRISLYAQTINGKGVPERENT